MVAPSRDGEILEGKYRLLRKLGEGAMGAVYAGENLRVKRMVAIKVLHAAASAIREMTERFEREAQAAGQIGNDHITEVYDLGTTSAGERYMVLEYLEGETLRARIKRRKRLEPAEASHLVGQMLDGLEAAHRAGIIHRDVKPDNVFIVSSKAGRRDFVKILDFGISKFTAQAGEEGSATRTGTVMGSPNYMSPEHVRGTHEVDARSDLYSVGVMLYEALTGALPRNAKNFAELLFKVAYEPMPDPRHLVPTLPDPLVAVIQRACATDPNARFQTAAELAQALRAAAPPLDASPEITGTGLSVAAASWGQKSQPTFGGSSQPSHPGAGSQPSYPEAGAQPSYPGAGSHPSFTGSGSHPSFGSSGSHPSFGGSGSHPSFGGSGSHPGLPGASASHPGVAIAEEKSQPDPNGTAIIPLSASSPSWRGDASGVSHPAAPPVAFPPGEGSVPSFSQHGAATAAGVTLGKPPGEPKNRRPLMIAIGAGVLVGVIGLATYATLGTSGAPASAAGATSSDAKAAPTTTPSPKTAEASAATVTPLEPTAQASAAATGEATSTASAVALPATKPSVKPRVTGPKQPKGPDPGY
ncbi:MAG: protein kinase [Polyangiaceae bacterium]|jgi:serine/threonine protein kinase|nr:protein kinase [Polyangiaceae bacterium]MBK8943557.1 protein kinase [Polyangiaceae bacterium]